MRVCYGEPPAGRRQLLCKGEEATVRRIISGKYEGLVERVQPVSAAPPGHEFSLVSSYHGNYLWGKGNPVVAHNVGAHVGIYHLLKSMALGYANAVMPENFVAPREVRFFRKTNGWVSAAYSDYVPDGTRVIKRRKAAMLRFHRAIKEYRGGPAGKETAKEFDRRAGREPLMIRDKSDAMERKLNPQLSSLAKRAYKSGILVPHPEANYHLSKGRTVFFEITALGIPRALSATSGSERSADAVRWLSTIYSVFLKAFAHAIRHTTGNERTRVNAHELAEAEFGRVFGAIHDFFTGKKIPYYNETFPALEVVKRGLKDMRLMAWIEGMESQASCGAPACEFDEPFASFFNGRTPPELKDFPF